MLPFVTMTSSYSIVFSPCHKWRNNNLFGNVIMFIAYNLKTCHATKLQLCQILVKVSGPYIPRLQKKFSRLLFMLYLRGSSSKI